MTGFESDETRSISFLRRLLWRVLPAVKKRATRIKLFLMDVDGTMTDGSVTLLSQTDGTALEIKTFDAHDGQGLTLAQTAGLRTGCITGRESAALLRRAHEMKMEFIYMKQPLKMPAYEEILCNAGLSDSAVAYIGDDLPDIPPQMRTSKNITNVNNVAVTESVCVHYSVCVDVLIGKYKVHSRKFLCQQLF